MNETYKIILADAANKTWYKGKETLPEFTKGTTAKLISQQENGHISLTIQDGGQPLTEATARNHALVRAFYNSNTMRLSFDGRTFYRFSQIRVRQSNEELEFWLIPDID